MRAKRVAVGVHVKIIACSDSGKLGVIDAVSEGKNGQIISVRCEGDSHSYLYKASELVLAQPVQKQVKDANNG